METLEGLDSQSVTELAQKAFGELSGNLHELATGDQGASGAKLRYFQAGNRKFVAKHATPLERKVMNLLQEQGQAVPRLATDTGAASRDWLVMEFAEEIPGNENEDPEWSAKLGTALANIHARNMGQRPDWLKVLSLDDEVKDAYCHEWQPLFHKLIETDQEFAKLHGDKMAQLDASWEDFKAALAHEMGEKTNLTLISTDLIPGHWRQVDHAPVLIDWEQARFGSLYLDLPNMFNEKTVDAYYQALVHLGVEIAANEFANKFASLSRYLGFRYMSVGLEGWPDGRNIRPDKEYWEKSGKQFFDKCLEIAMYGYPKPALWLEMYH